MDPKCIGQKMILMLQDCLNENDNQNIPNVSFILAILEKSGKNVILLIWGNVFFKILAIIYKCGFWEKKLG